ncbi:uncharacterized protein LOC123560671 [Mercenaria mercenaria]|uniref:uncharacterized protein LOC123560671 n=1 Tax=Mercenaria mercenaria TaxID=6596 RepID=UPI00234E376D|nr:uncharacterized protein LOC123560671 [Mercenaria mercenaria]
MDLRVTKDAESEVIQKAIKAEPVRSEQAAEPVRIEDDFDKVKERASGKCRMMTSPWEEHLIQPDLISNMADWDFSHKRECKQFSIKNLPAMRSKFSLNCDSSLPTIVMSETDNSDDIFDLNFGDKCLSNFVENCCVDENPVPNVVHYVWYGGKQLGFFNFLSLMSVLRFKKPCAILIHGPTLPHGPYWEYFLHMSPNIIHVYRERPEVIFRHTLRFKEHSSDVMRIEALIEYGGIYLDFDEVLLRPIDSLRRFQYTQGHELPKTMGSQVVISKKNATFLRLWYLSYRDDYKKIWAYNALWVPNTLAKNYPELIHIEGFNFTRPNWQNVKLIYDANYNWATNYGMHMYARWYKRPVNPDIIRTLNSTVGSVSRHILFGNKELCVS